MKPALPALACLLALAACGPESKPRTEPQAPMARPSLAGTRWVLTHLDRQPVPAKPPISLEFEPTRLGGYAGCNWYGATWAWHGGRLRVGAAEQSARGCAAPILARESAYLARLRESEGARLAPERLTLLDANGAPRLVFARRAVVAADPQALVGSRWRLVEPADAPATTGPIRIAFDEGRMAGFGGCRAFDGEYAARDDGLVFPSLRMHDTECRADAAMQAREGAFIAALSETTSWAIDEDTLRLTTVDGEVLEWRREP